LVVALTKTGFSTRTGPAGDAGPVHPEDMVSNARTTTVKTDTRAGFIGTELSAIGI
jgi:hypothetical protein